MTGPEHYREAGRMAGHCATEVADADLEGREVSSVTSAYIALAQVHATLAQAAASAQDPWNDLDAAWTDVIR